MDAEQIKAAKPLELRERRRELSQQLDDANGLEKVMAREDAIRERNVISQELRSRGEPLMTGVRVSTAESKKLAVTVKAAH